MDREQALKDIIEVLKKHYTKEDDSRKLVDLLETAAKHLLPIYHVRIDIEYINT
ncbi:MAG: hypothetical protein AB1847_17475 [bacterium]